ncbi:hypothetical protein ABPG75_006093 [Micractinium tetrahymenae]
MQEEAAGGGTGRAGSGSLKRSLDSRAPKAARQERWSADSAREGGAAGVALTSAPAAALKLGSSLPGAPLAQGPPAAAALAAKYAAELAQEEEFAHAATPAAYPRLNARGRQYVAAFRRELLAWGRQRLAGTDPEELVAEYAGGLELEAPFSVAPAAAVGAAGPCGGDSGD